jgi:hypothetical protein
MLAAVAVKGQPVRRYSEAATAKEQPGRNSVQRLLEAATVKEQPGRRYSEAAAAKEQQGQMLVVAVVKEQPDPVQRPL